MLPRSDNGSNGRLTLDTVDRNSNVRVVRVSGRPRLIQRLAADRKRFDQMQVEVWKRAAGVDAGIS